MSATKVYAPCQMFADAAAAGWDLLDVVQGARYLPCGVLVHRADVVLPPGERMSGDWGWLLLIAGAMLLYFGVRLLTGRVKPTTYTCDDPGCAATLDVPAATPADADRKAARAGWTYEARTDRALCPEHAAVPEEPDDDDIRWTRP